MENTLEQGIKYQDIGGRTFQVSGRPVLIDPDGRGSIVYCLDGWNRFSTGPNAGRWVGKEKEDNYARHTNWAITQREPEQLSLFE